MKGVRILVGMAWVAAWVAGCATDVGTIDRTQAERLPKKQFAGVWYMNQTVIDIPYSGAWSFVGETNFGATGKVIFDIQEKHLVVYPVVQYIEGSEKQWHQQRIFRYWDEACTSEDSEAFQCVDGKDNLADPTRKCCFVEMYVGQPMAMFPITSHFDVQRRYNAQTGEQTNVIEENSSDRKWWQRKYMRVNWARNEINDFTFMARMVSQSPVDYYVQADDPTNPDAPTFLEDYIDVVTKVYGEPSSTGTCDIYGVSTADCAPALIKFRTAFRKVDHVEDYEPLRFHNEDRQALFGYFLTERNAYDPNYGLTEMGRVSFINRWNIWQKTFQETPVLDDQGRPVPCFRDLAHTGCDTTNRDGTKQFCSAPGWFERGTCVTRKPLPYSERGLKPIVYHVSYDLPELYWPGSVRTAEIWSKAFQETVAWLYLWEEKGRILGQDSLRACGSDADCASHALVDRFFDLDEIGNQDDLPKTGAGKILWSSIAKTAVARTGGRTVLVPDWRYPTDLTSKCGVRLINLAEGTTLDLGVGGSTVLTGIAAITQDSMSPLDPPHASVAPASQATFQVLDGGNAVASVVADCPVNQVVTLVWDGTSLATSTAAKSDIRGLRVINMTGQAADLSIAGGIRMYSMLPGASSGYQLIAGGGNSVTLGADYVPQRLVLTPAGSRGDVTCFRENQVGRCVGYDNPMTDADWARFEEIKALLPPMFTMCRNTYTPAVEGGALNDDRWASNLFAPWSVIRNASPDELNRLPVVNPCVDFLPGAQKLDAAKRLELAKSMKKIGDSRFSMINWVSEAQFSSPLGYGPSAADPDTGEVFWATANIYGAPLEFYGTLYRDLFDLIRGRLQTSDYITGQRVRDYVLGNEDTFTGPDSLPVEKAMAPLGLKPRDLVHDGHDHGRVKPGDVGIQTAAPVTPRQMLAVLRDARLKDALQTVPVRGTSWGTERLKAVQGTWLEQMLVNDEVRHALDSVPGGSSASPLEWANLEAIQKKERERQVFLGQHAYCYGEFADEGMVGMVKSWACMPGDTRPRCDEKTFDPLDQRHDTDSACCIDDSDFLARAVAQRFFTAVVEHEVGHTVGLRHNFAASTDLFNYFDRYFDIREKEPVPCTMDDECDAPSGQYCGGGYCRYKKVETCTKKTDCGFVGGGLTADWFDCVGGQCVELTRCGLHGECPSGAWCNGDDRLCYTGTGTEARRIENPVQNGEDDLVRAMIPRAGMTEREANLSRTIYQYSSIMDYGQRWNSDILDIGKYDHAAIRFGYGGLVDVFTDVSRLHQRIHTDYLAYGYDNEAQTSDALDTSYWNWGVYFSQFYFLNTLIGDRAIRSQGEFARNRAAVPWEALRAEETMVTNYYRNYADKSYVMVPYKFSGDEYNGNVGVYTWDTGVDPLEIVHNMGIALKEYYLLDAFKRERYGAGLHGNPMSYLSRIQSRYMEPMRGCGMYYALFAHILKNYPWRGLWANARQMGWALRRASETGFELLAQSLASPAPGSYRLDVDRNLFRNFSYDVGAPGSQLDIPLGVGKYPYTTFWDGAGYFFWDHALYIGSFWERIAALMTLTDSTVYFTTNYVGEQLNIGVGTSIGFNTMYPQQLAEVFGGIITGEPAMFAGSVQNGKFVPRAIFDPDNSDVYSSTPSPYLTPAGVPTGSLVEPSIQNLTMRLYLMLYGMAYLPASFDPSFLDSFAICLKGNGNCHDLAPSSGITTEEFTDPYTGKTYVTWAPTYRAGWYSPNVELVRKAVAKKAAWEAATTPEDRAKAETELREIVETLDLMRGVYEIYSKMKI
ncbi:zinc-dependent metalloprotease [Myxococcota bacterium]|nr:zinc-dependent metalloprotease [Myxococcota bacterium]